VSDTKMVSIDPNDQEVRENYQLLIGGVGPRPIAFVSTMSPEGVSNLAPYSFFNAFSANPPVVGFSPTRSRDNKLKDTCSNIMATKECVVQVCTYDMVEQINLASVAFPSDVDEFVKAGFTPVYSDVVKPKRVLESPFQMECELLQVVEFGDQPLSGNLILCEVKRFHIAESVMTDGAVDPHKIDLIGRNGGPYYTRSKGDALFAVGKPGRGEVIGFDGLPEWVKQSSVLTANDLGKLAMGESWPTQEEMEAFFEAFKSGEIKNLDFSALLNALEVEDDQRNAAMEPLVQAALKQNDVELAIKLVHVTFLLADD